MRKERPRSAWIIEWVWFGDHRKVKSELLHVLNPRINHRTVLDYMKCLYMNSELASGVDRLGFLSSKYWKGLVIHEGTRMFLGDNPFLVAWSVKDLTIEVEHKESREVFRWTQQPGRRYNEQVGEFEDLGRPKKRVAYRPHG